MMERKPLIFVSTENMPTFCRSRCNNSNCSRHMTKAVAYKGPCIMSLLKGSKDCEGYISTRKQKEDKK